MTAPWQPPPLNEAAADALDLIGQPSRPGPLAGSTRIGEQTWRTDLAPAAVLAAYQASDAPIPTGATVETTADGTAAIHAPFSTTAVLIDQVGAGTTYHLVPGPTLSIQTVSGSLPNGEFYVHCGVDTVDLNTGGPTLFAIAMFQQAGKHWFWGVADPDSDDGTVKPLVSTLATLDPADPSSLSNISAEKAVPCTAAEDNGRVTASFTVDGTDVAVTAHRTSSAMALLIRLQPA